MENADYKIFTIGHGKRKIEELIDLLNKYQIKVLIDVRSLPYSRFNPQFRQSNLQKSLESADIKYIFLGKELGGRPTDQTLYINGVVSYDAIKQTDTFKAGIRQVIEFVKGGIKVTLMCSESDPNDCHRKHLIAGELEKEELKVLHISKLGAIEPQLFALNNNLFS
jgi:uncharacterized protein (DUF488 family)